MQETFGINSEPEGKSFAAFKDHFLIRCSLWTLSSLLQAKKKNHILQGVMFSPPRYLGTNYFACESVRTGKYSDGKIFSDLSTAAWSI